VFRSAAAKPGKRDKAAIIKSNDGMRVALVKNEGDRLSLVVDKKSQAEFAAYLVESLPEIYARFCAREKA
jgi:ParB family chromosome partitioning protein